MKPFITIFFASLSLILFSCGEDESNCNNGKIIAQVTKESARLYFNAEHEVYFVDYFVPGTVDAFYRGFICTNAFPDFEFTEGMQVIFSGNFRETDLYNKDDFEVPVAGLQVYMLELQMLAAE